MWRVGSVIIVAVAVIVGVSLVSKDSEEEQAAWQYILALDKAWERRAHQLVVTTWAYQTNVTKHNEEIYKINATTKCTDKSNPQIQAQLAKYKQDKLDWEKTRKFDWRKFENYTLRRMFEFYSELGLPMLPEHKYEQLKQVVVNMEANYATAKVWDYKREKERDLSGLTEILTNSQDHEELKYVWLEWHKVAGAAMKDNFTTYVLLSNEAAQLNGYKNMADWWIAHYEVSDFEEQLARIWNDVKPLYQQLHAYARKQLRNLYGEQVVSAKGPIPAHLLGNMWAQEWENLDTFPFPDRTEINITQAMYDQKYTSLKMCQMADEFFTSLNLTAVPQKFWQNSIIEKPNDRLFMCQPSSWDFCDGEDFRIKQCATVNDGNFYITHHEMGHIQYYLQYRHQPYIFREGPNPGFHEAIGDTIALSVSSRKHLRRIGLIEKDDEEYEDEINQLYKIATDKVVFLPFGYLIDLYRYGVFRGTTGPEGYNCHYWALREKYQGVEPPETRTEDDFDALAKYHVSGDIEFMRYYVATIIQFQFHRTLCELAGEVGGPDSNTKLVDCDINRSTTAGNALAKMLRMGASQPWPDVMQVLTGQREMKADSFLQYFKPLQEWLKRENQRTGEHI